jgi:hypothetical protein
MDLKEILTVSAKSGLFKLISKSKDHLIVESLTDKTRIPVFLTEKMSSLEDICIFTESEDLPLKDAFKKIYTFTNGDKAIDSKAKNEELKSYMDKVIPEYNKEKVYVSDMKKLFTWYNFLHENNMLTFKEEESADVETEKEANPVNE